MGRTRARLDTRWLRLLEASPLIVGAYLALLLALVPWPIAVRAMTGPHRPDPSAPLLRPSLEEEARYYIGERADSTQDGDHPLQALRHVADSSVGMSAAGYRLPVDSLARSGAPRLSQLSGAVDSSALATFERDYRARVYVYSQPTPPRPPGVAVTGDPEVLRLTAKYLGDERAVERLYETIWHQERELASEGRPAFPPLGGTQYGVIASDESSFFAPNGRMYHVVVLYRAQTTELPYPAQELAKELEGSEPRTARFERALREFAERTGSAILVGGPMDIEHLPLRTIDGAPSAEVVMKSLWRDTLELSADSLEPVPREKQEVLPARWFATTARYASTSPTAPLVVFLATWADAPPRSGLPAEGTPAAAWRRLRIAASGVSDSLFLGGGLALLASVVASPLAFRAHRRRREHDRVAEEMRRVQRDAHDKVYNRLAALSRQVEDRADAIHADLDVGLEGIAADLQGTVGDLRRILGEGDRDTARHDTDAADGS